MRSRCSNPNNIGYSDYGGRGVTVCDRWLNSFENFLADMGLKPEPKQNYSIDRWPDKDGNYEPGNCRWATRSEQTRNRRITKLTMEIVREIRRLYATGNFTQADLAKKFGISSGSKISEIITNKLWREDSDGECSKSLESGGSEVLATIGNCQSGH